MTNEVFEQQIMTVRRRVRQLLGGDRSDAECEEPIRAALAEFDGVLRELQLTGDVLRLENQELAAACRRVEAEVRQYRRFLSSGPFASLVTDNEGRIAEANSAARRLVGIHEEDGGSLFDRVHPEDRALLRQFGEHLDTGEQPGPIRFRLQREDETITVTAYGVPADGPHRLRWLLDVTEHVSQSSARLATSGRDAQDRLLDGLDRVLEVIPQLVWTTLPDGEVEYFNQRWYTYTGLTPQQSLGLGWLQVVHPDDRASCYERWEQTVRTGELLEIEYRLRRSDGAYRWHLGRAALIRDESGRPLRWFGTCTDIHDQKQIEAHLGESREELADLFDNAAIGLHCAAEDGTILRANRVELEMLGYAPREYVGHNIRAFHADPRVADEMLERLRRGEVVRQLPARLRCRDGSYREVLIDADARLQAGRFVQCRCFTRDVTDQRRTERRVAAEHAVTRIIAEADSLEAAASGILRAIAESIDCDVGEIWRHNAETNLLVCAEIHAAVPEVAPFVERCRRTTFVPGVGLPGRAWAQRGVVWISDLAADTSFPRKEAAVESGLRSGFAFPILLGDQLYAVMEFLTRRRLEPDEALIAMLGAISSELAQFMQRRRAEEALQQSTERFQNILESITDNFYTLDRTWRITYMNRQCERHFRRPVKSLIGRNLFEEYPEILGTPVEACFRKVLETGQAGELEYLAPDERIWFEVRVYPVREGLGVYFRDITDRKHAEEATARLAALVESSDDAIIGKDIEGRVLSWNAGAERIYGYTAEEMIGQPIAVLSPPGSEAELADLHARVRRGERVQQFETLRVAKGGRILDVAMTISPIRDHFGNIVGMSTIARDITGRKRVETELRDSEARTRGILDTAVDGIITIDRQGVMLSLNSAAERIFGYSREEMIGRNVNMLMPSPYAEEHDGYLANYLRTGIKRIIGIGREVLGRRKDGTVFPMDLAVSETSTKDGILFTGIVRDITERKQAEQTIREQREEMEDFLSIVAHDLKRPLVSLHGLLSMIREDVVRALDDEGREIINMLFSECARMQDIIKVLSDISRIGKSEIALEPVNLERFLRDTAARFESTAAARGCTILVDAPAMRLALPRAQVQEALENLLDNALKYGCPGPDAAGEQVAEIHLTAEVEFWSVRITVGDSGPGIAPEYHQRIFEMFRRLSSGDTKGSGVGLTAVQRLMKRVGGRVLLDSAPGQGARFTLEFAVRPV